MAILLVVETSKLLQPWAVFRRLVLSQFARSQAVLNELYRPPQMHPGELYASTVKSFGIALLFGPIFPLARARAPPPANTRV